MPILRLSEIENISMLDRVTRTLRLYIIMQFDVLLSTLSLLWSTLPWFVYCAAVALLSVLCCYCWTSKDVKRGIISN